MQVVHARQAFPERWTTALFLAGPTPRAPDVPSWRPAALEHLARRGFDGVVFVPEDASGTYQGEYLDQVEWERDGLRFADRIAATLSAHVAHAYAAELTAAELAEAKALAAAGTPHGAGGSERTIVEVTTVRALLAGELADWSTVGIVLAALMESTAPGEASPGAPLRSVR